MDAKKNLLRAFEEILDKMAFMFFEEPEEGEEAEEVDEDFRYLTKVSFSGAIDGYLHVFFSRNLAEQMARNFVGIRDEDEVFENSVIDAIREFTNMVMGRTMTTLDPEHGFEMDVPHVVEDMTQPPEGMEVAEIIGQLDDDPCKLVLVYKAKVA